MQLKSLFLLSIISYGVSVQALEVKMTKPNIKIVVPEIPEMKMEKHPLSGVKPHLRLIGSKDGYTASVITPTADKGMTPEECASSRIGSLIEQFDLKEGQFKAMKGADGNTFAVYFPVRLESVVQLNAYLLSSHQGEYCVEVHISKISTEVEEGIKWIDGFPDAMIISY